MQTRTENIESLFLDGVYDIPEYQRSYAWDVSQLDDFLADLRYLPEDRVHFFGNVVLDENEEPYETVSERRLNVYRVVDGQQRLTTALIFLKVASELDPTVAAPINEANLIHLPGDRPRLLPQDQDGEFFRDRILGSMTLAAETPSQTRLIKAREYFKEQLNGLLNEISVSTLAKRLRYDFQINVVEVDSDSEAASIFESINDRGKPLSSLEKTKSFLMYMENRAGGGQALRSHINQRFGGIYRDLYVLEDGHSRAKDFDEDSIQQFHWGLYDGYDSDEYSNSLATLKGRLYEMYREGEYEGIRSTIDEYTEGLREASGAFAALFRPDRSSDHLRKRLYRLLEIGRLANVLPVLMAAHLRYGDQPERMADLVEKCETLVFRLYAIDRRRSDTGQSKLIRLAHRIHTDQEYGFEAIMRRLESITREYTDDDRFERALRDPDFYDTINSRDVRYLFYHYGQVLEAEDREFVQRDLQQILSAEFQVEHIFARGLGEEHIPEELREEYENHVNRLGNLTVASRYWNSTYGAIPFDEKKRVPGSESSSREKAYENSMLKVQRVLTDIDKFDRETIDTRENAIVDFALEEWSIDTDPRKFSEVSEISEILDAFKRGEEIDYEVSPTERAVMRALVEKPGRALRKIHRTAASFEDSPIEWTEKWSSERTAVQEILYELRSNNLAYLNKQSWYPVIESGGQ